MSVDEAARMRIDKPNSLNTRENQELFKAKTNTTENQY